MYPIFHERFKSAGRFHLGDFGFVVREDEVDGAAVDVVLRAEEMLGDGGVLDVPARPAFAEWRVPARFVRHLELPEAEVVPAALLLAVVDAGLGIVFLHILPAGQLTIFGEG